jgi:hypothetical protein
VLPRQPPAPSQRHMTIDARNNQHLHDDDDDQPDEIEDDMNDSHNNYDDDDNGEEARKPNALPLSTLFNPMVVTPYLPTPPLPTTTLPQSLTHSKQKDEMVDESTVGATRIPSSSPSSIPITVNPRVRMPALPIHTAPPSSSSSSSSLSMPSIGVPTLLSNAPNSLSSHEDQSVPTISSAHMMLPSGAPTRGASMFETFDLASYRADPSERSEERKLTHISPSPPPSSLTSSSTAAVPAASSTQNNSSSSLSSRSTTRPSANELTNGATSNDVIQPIELGWKDRRLPIKGNGKSNSNNNVNNTKSDEDEPEWMRQWRRDEASHRQRLIEDERRREHQRQRWIIERQHQHERDQHSIHHETRHHFDEQYQNERKQQWDEAARDLLEKERHKIMARRHDEQQRMIDAQRAHMDAYGDTVLTARASQVIAEEAQRVQRMFITLIIIIIVANLLFLCMIDEAEEREQQLRQRIRQVTAALQRQRLKDNPTLATATTTTNNATQPSPL